MTSNGLPIVVSEDELDEMNTETKSSNQERFAPGEIKRRRDRLFKQGSAFKPIAREEIIGIDNVLYEIDQIIHWLKHSDEYANHQSRLEPGVIFEGRPGTGKTLVSRYIASASNALFINVREFEHEGSLFKDRDIADLFNRARQKFAQDKRPIVLFWDEFEGAAMSRELAESDQAAVVSQITSELDGVHGKNEGILLVGCTNYIGNIDEALMRAGRMGLQIEFHAPDRAGKQMILKHYLNSFPNKGEIDIETLSYCFDSTDTAADIEEACVEAWRVAIWRFIEDKTEPVLTQADLLKVFLKRLVGPPTSFVNLPEEDRFRIAVHECGHALMACAYDIPLRLITIHPGKKSLGRVMTIELNEHIATVDELRSLARICVGSMEAEKVVGLPAHMGTKGDIKELNTICHQLVDELDEGERSGAVNPSTMGENRNHLSTTIPNVSLPVIENLDLDYCSLMQTLREEGRQTMEAFGPDVIKEMARIVCAKTTMTGVEFQKELEKILPDGDPSSYRV